MNSIWTETTNFLKRPALLGDMSIDTAIIGGGMAGILTAFLLKQKGIEVIVLEANQIGSGQTKNTTAKITSQHNLIYDTLIQQFGIEKAFQYADANQKAIAQYHRIIQEHGIECEFEEQPSYLYSTVETKSLKREVEAALRLGIDATFTTDTTLPFTVKGAVKFQGQAQFHPLKFLKSIAEALTIYEYTDVKTVEDNRIVTDSGIVTARHIVFASHFPFINAPGYYFMRLNQERSYVLALENTPVLNGMYLGIDENGLSFRNSGSLLLLGGGKHRTGENPTGGKYQMLRDAASSYWPECHEAAAWSAQDCMSLDSIPYIGQFSASTPNWYVATGFGKWGMTSSMVSAQSDFVPKLSQQKTPPGFSSAVRRFPVM